MNVENNHTAATGSEQTKDGSHTITIQTTLGDEDEDVHKCGRCRIEFSTLEAFFQHKLQHNCKRAEASSPEFGQEAPTTNGSSPLEVPQNGDASEDGTRNAPEDKSSVRVGRSRRTKTAPLDNTAEQTIRTRGSKAAEGAPREKQDFKVNKEGRYVCPMCDKTFKTNNILRTHLKTHSDLKGFSCYLCGTSFRTKGSLIRHNRRHTDERPYRCSLCGQSFRESGALTRHLKALTPCTEKIRFVQYKEILVSKDGAQKGVEDQAAAEAGAAQQEVVVVNDEAEEQVVEAEAAVVSVAEPVPQEVLHQVHFTMEVDGTTQEQQVVVEQAQAEALAAAAAAGDSLICQAIINSGIALGREEAIIEDSQSAEDTDRGDSDCPQADEGITEIHVKEELVELEMETEVVDGRTSSKMHMCPHCNRSFKGLNYFRFHVKGHLGYKPFKCTLCQKDFLTGYLLKKHMEIHVSERRYKCGECGKLYKTIGHVREHMRAHSDERPYHCSRCSKGYKTKNALQVHQRTHGDEKPYVCQYCTRGFREKGSLVRHIRHHTGEKPFKCPKCSRGFAEHGTLNRHMRAKGGCQREESGPQEAATTEEPASADSLATAAIITEDPHAVLVEFSSVVADTQEYIIKTETQEDAQEQGVTLIEDGQNEMGNHIMKVVQRLVSQSQGGSGGRQFIVRNMTGEEGPSVSDCGDTITIATPESLTEQVAITLASAISDGTLLASAGHVDASDGPVTVVTVEGQEEEVAEVREEEGEEREQVEAHLVQQQQQQQQEYVITSPEEVEIQTVVV